MSDVKSTSVEVRLPSRLGYEKVAMSTAAAVAKLMGFREDRIEDLKTAVAEACINAIEHGNRLNEGTGLSADRLSPRVPAARCTQARKPGLGRTAPGGHFGRQEDRALLRPPTVRCGGRLRRRWWARTATSAPWTATEPPD